MEGPIDDSAMMELLAKHLAGECTPEEAAQVVAWLAAAPENAATYEAMQAIWTQADAPDLEAQARTDAAWQRMQARMQASAQAPDAQASEPDVRPLQQPTARPWIRHVAAIVAIAVSISFIFITTFNRRQPETELAVVESGDKQRTDTLPDGTVVYLNAHSRLEYPKAFAAGERVVGLEGEAFFEVAHDAAHPFRIHASGADVRVLGTSFNLSTRGARVEVAVQTGRVELSAQDSLPGQARSRVLLSAGMAGSYDRQSKAVAQAQADVENAQFWRTRRLVFHHTPMSDVVAELNEVFEDSVVLGNPGIGNCKLNTTFDQPSIDSVIAVIVETFPFKVTRNGNTIVLDGQACL